MRHVPQREIRMSEHSRREFLKAGFAAAAASSLPAFGAAEDVGALTLKGASELIRRRDVSPVELTEACLKRIETYNPSLNAFITITRDQAVASAREMEAELKRGKRRGPLHGIPIALKDNIDTAGIRTTAASGVFKDRVPAEDAEVVVRLKKAGAILLGKLNLHEFALGGTSAVTYFGPVHNPWALDHHPGGSSGGSGAAIAAHLCIAALGTDTGGSIRIPASHCGIVGLKPTYGRVSNRGVIPMSWTLDHVGPMCKTVEDAAILLTAIAGYDDLDPSTANLAVPDYTRAVRTPVAKLRVGIPKPGFFENLHPEVAKALETARGVLGKLTAGIREVDIPAAGPVADVWNAEIYAYHAPWFTKTPELYQEATRAFIRGAANASSAVYAQARRHVDVVRREIKNAFNEVDLLITPTQRTPAGLIVPAQAAQNTNRGAAPPAGAGGPGGALNNTAAFNIYGLPTISIPCGFTVDGLPIGLQISGAPFAETTVIALAHAYEQATEWHTRRPKILS
jgi:aspartyl-tRNA(Asn)/glutamyl-tRNA(Gln) amidotransferase subunit A